MARSGKYTKAPCRHCGKVVSTWGPGAARHAKFCEGAARERRENARVFRTAYRLSGAAKRRK